MHCYSNNNNNNNEGEIMNMKRSMDFCDDEDEGMKEW